MTIAVDTNVLLDVQTGDANYFASSAHVLERAAAEGALIIGEVVYGELATRMAAREVDLFLSDLGIAYQPSTLEALRRAGATYRRYVENRGPQVQCANCARRFAAACPSCGQTVSWRQHLLPDFLVGAHAQELAGSLLTRDRGIYRRFFPGLARYD